MPGPLSHIRVLDLSRILAGPWASQILADLGAQVIKVERPGAGDDTRAWGPPFLKNRDGGETGAGYYLAANRGKRSITVDLQTAEGQQIIRDIAAESDVVLENYKVGTLDRYGLGYRHLSEINPSLVYCSITGFGQGGPLAAQPAYDFLVQAMSGIMSITGVPDNQPGAGPMKVGVPIVDLVTGVYAATAICAALASCALTGKGDHIDMAMLDVGTAILSNQAMNALLTGAAPPRRGNAHPNIQPQKVYSCADDDIILVVGNDSQFASLCTALGLPDLSSDPRFRTNGARVKNQALLDPVLEAAFRGLDRATCLDRLSRANVPAGPINTIPQTLAEPQVIHRRMVRPYDFPAAGEVPLVVSPFRFASGDSNATMPPPELGEHTAEVLAAYGIDAGRLADLRLRGVV